MICRDYVHNLEITASLANRARDMARYYDAQGDKATASGYWAEYRIWKDEYNHWADRAVASGC